jgi:hypothetical protein
VKRTQSDWRATVTLGCPKIFLPDEIKENYLTSYRGIRRGQNVSERKKEVHVKGVLFLN